MKASRFSIGLAVLAFAGAARAQSSVPCNYVDDFCSDRPSALPVEIANVEQTSPSHAFIACNYVDDFCTEKANTGPGPLSAARDEAGDATRRAAPTHAIAQTPRRSAR